MEQKYIVIREGRKHFVAVRTVGQYMVIATCTNGGYAQHIAESLNKEITSEK